MSGIKDRFHVTALSLGLVALSGLSLASMLSAQQTIALDADVSAEALTALKGLQAQSLLLPDGRALTLDAKQLVLRARDATGKQNVPLPEQRVGATAAALPDGRVLIWGGADVSGKLLRDGLWFDPRTGGLEAAQLPTLPAGVGQSITVLSDGQLLVTGGWNASNRYLEQATLWNPRSGQTQNLGVPFGPRYGQRALLQDDGTAVFWGGLDEQLHPIAGTQSFDPSTWRFETKTGPHADGSALKVVATHPGVDQDAVAPDALVGVRFSVPVDSASVSAANVSLIGPAGPVGASIAGVQDGRLAFVTPDEDLLPATHYTVVLSGVKDGKGQVLPFTTFKFTTAALGAGDKDAAGRRADSSSTAAAAGAQRSSASSAGSGITYYRSTGMDKLGHAAAAHACRPDVLRRPRLCRDKSYFEDGAWYPGQDNVGGPDGGHWRVNVPDMAPEELVAAFAHDRKKAQAKTAAATGAIVTGQVRLVDGRAIGRVRVSVGKAFAYTDEHGNFLLSGVPNGHQALFVDGSSAGDAGHRYGQFELGIDVGSGETRLPFRMYLPRILDRDRIEVPSPTTQDMVVTHPDMPGLEVHIPAGTVFRDHNGKVVTEVAIVPMPTDRSPYPTPVNFPVYFSLQPGGAVIQNVHADVPQGITLTYPNYGKVAPGYPAEFIAYSPVDGWRTYGKGQITPDGTQLKAESGVRLTAMAVASWNMGTQHTGDPNAAKPGGPCCGDPVDLMSGTLVESHTDVAINDIMPIGLTRQWHGVGHSALMNASATQDTRGFGSWRSNYDMYVNGVWANPGVRLADGNLLAPFTAIDTNPGSDATWAYSGNVAGFAGAILDAPLGGYLCDSPGLAECYILALADGTRYYFEDYNGLYEIRDRFDNRVRIVRSAGLIQQIISPSGRYLTLQYNSDNNVSQVADHTGRTWTYSYHNAKFPVAGWSAAGPGSNPQQATMYFLDKVTYPDQTFTSYKYNEDFTLPAGGGSGCAAPYPSTMTSMIDRNGATVMTNTYCGEQVSKQVLADGGTYQFSYLSGANGAETDVTDPLGNLSKTVFDPATGYPASVTYAAGTALAQTTTYTRNTAGQVLSVTDALNRTTSFTYDASGNPLTITRMAGTSEAATKSFTWSGSNQLLSGTDELGHTTRLTYLDGCLSSATDALGNKMTVQCDPQGRPVLITDPLGHQTTFHFAGSDLQSVTNAAGRTVTFDVDALGRPIAIADPLGNRVARTYDLSGRPDTLTDARGQVTRFVYDNEGHVTSVALPNQTSVAYQYDPNYRVKLRTDALGQAESWTYDVGGNVRTHTDKLGQLTDYAPRDGLGRFTKTTYADGSTVVADVYDAAGRLKQLTDSSYGTMTQGFDDFDRVISESSPQGSIAYTYFANDLRKSMTPGGQAAVAYDFYDNNLVRSIKQGSEVVAFSYDGANRRQTMTLPNGVVTTYGYNEANQVVSLGYKNASGVVGDLAYTYDGDGRRMSQSGSFAPGKTGLPTTVASQFDANNRQGQMNGRTLTYDKNGNLIADGLNTYVWNARHQLVQIQQGATVVAQYQYDPMGRRVSKTLGGISTSFLYDGLSAVQETQGSTVNPILTGLGVDERFARNEGGVRSYFLADALGSTVGLTDAGAALIQRYQYDPYGNVTPTGGASNPYQYTGREVDGVDLYYYRARYYSPSMGRFISEDQFGFDSGQLNFYSYAGGNPMDYRDPSGHLLVEAAIGAVIGGAWGYASGYFSGDTGEQLRNDVLMGAGVGFFAGLTDGVSLMEGSAARTALGYATRAALNVEGEMLRQGYNNHGCIDHGGDIAVAGIASLLGDGLGTFVTKVAGMSGYQLARMGKTINAVAQSEVSGFVQTVFGQQEHFEEVEAKTNKEWTKLQESHRH